MAKISSSENIKSTLTLAQILQQTVVQIVNGDTNQLSSNVNTKLNIQKAATLGNVISSSLSIDSDQFYKVTSVIDIEGVQKTIINEGLTGSFDKYDVDAQVLINYDQNGEAYVAIGDDKLETYIVAINKVKLSTNKGGNITCNGSGTVELNGTDFGGLVKIEELTAKLNKLKDEVNALKTSYASHNHPYVNVTAPATTSTITVPFEGTFTAFNKNDYENTNVKHGETVD